MPNKLAINDPAAASRGSPGKKVSLELESLRARSIHTVLVLEPRDEVFARLAADFAGAGFEVIRATTAPEASCQFARHRTALILANVDLPDESGWLFAHKMRLSYPSARIWIYTHRLAADDAARAEFLGVDELIYYGGDLWRLARQILDCVGNLSANLLSVIDDARRPSAADRCAWAASS